MTKTMAQDYSMGALTEKGILSTVNNEMAILNVKEFPSYEERIAVLYGIWSDDRFWVNADENDGAFLVGPTELLNKNAFETTLSEAIVQFCEEMRYISKDEKAETLENMKQELPNDFLLSVMMDYYDRSMNSGNNLCISAERICFQNGLYTFPAGVNTGSAEAGPDYSCLRTQPNPAWFFVEMQEPGNISIYMYTTPSHDIDFCCWGPFADLNVCPNGLTSNKVVSCSYSASATETCQIPSSAQPGEYYIMVITNYSNQTCNINFSKSGGTGNSDCTGSDYYVTSNSPVCYGSNLNLYARNIQGASYLWVGPDGWTSNQKDPVRPNMNMNYVGDYYCFISVDNDTISMSCNVECTPAVVADFIYTSVCLGDTTEFVCTATTNPPGYAITSIDWNLGDGTTATGYSVKHRYESAGNYSVTMTVQSEEACTGSKTYSVPVYYVPNANAGNDKYVRVGGTVTLTGTGGTGDFSYHWSPEDLVENPNLASTLTMPLYETQDFVLTVTSNVGNCTTSTDTVRVIVDPNAMTGTVTADDTELCHGTSTQLHAVASNGTGSYSYSWTPTTGLNNSNIANPAASPTVTTTYTCHFSDGQTTLDVPVTIIVHPTYYNMFTASICEGEEYIWYGQTYSESGVYLQHFNTIYGCDSIRGLNLIVNPVYNDTIEAEACEYYVWNDVTYYESGIYQQAFESTLGCDSIFTLNLTINNSCNHWMVEGEYESTMEIYAVASIDGVEQRTDQLEIGAFCYNAQTNEMECRGTAWFVYLQAQDRFIADLTVFGNPNDNIFFRLYDHIQFEEFELVSDNVVFEANTIMGNPSNPYTVNFRHEYTISATSNPAQYGSVFGAGSYLYGETVSLIASPVSNNYLFTNWTENGVIVSTDATYNFVAEADRNLVANFEWPTYTINASANPSVGGEISYSGDYVFDFEDGFQGWTTIDGGTPSGYGWQLASGKMGWGHGHNGSQDCMISISYDNGYGVIYPDNYLISPQIALGGSISFYACAQDANYAAEHFGVAVSTDGNTNPNDFTTIQEWTMTAKSVGAPTEVTRSGNRAQGYWFYYTVDLSAYAGQVGYVAIRHFNCSDMFYLDIDDVTIVAITDSAFNNGQYYQGQTCMLLATANNGFAFTNWTENDEIVSTDALYSFIVESDRSLVANFEALAHHWTSESYQNSMFMIGVVQIDGIEQASPILELGAFCNGECRGSVFPEKDGNRWLYYMAIGGNTGDNITFRLYDHALQQELDLYCYNEVPFVTNGILGIDNPYEVSFASMFMVSAEVSPEGAGTVSGTGVYIPGTSCTLVATPNEGYAFVNWTINGEVVSTEPSYTFTVTAPVTITANFNFAQEIQLAAGWNWFSTNLDITLDDLKAALVAALPGTQITIMSKTATTLYNGTRWRGALNTLDVTQMYMIEVATDYEITLVGVPLVPEEHPVTIESGAASWMGFPLGESMTISDAFAGFAVNGDIIISQAGSSAYLGTRWRGTVTDLVPGQGYIYISNATNARTLVFPTTAK